MIGGSGVGLTNAHRQAAGASGLFSLVADTARHAAVPSGCWSKSGREADALRWWAKPRQTCVT